MEKLAELIEKVDYAINGIGDISSDDLLLIHGYLELFKSDKNNERAKHGRTWNAAIQAHEDRGYVLARSITDFDEYEIK